MSHFSFSTIAGTFFITSNHSTNPIWQFFKTVSGSPTSQPVMESWSSNNCQNSTQFMLKIEGMENAVPNASMISITKFLNPHAILDIPSRYAKHILKLICAFIFLFISWMNNFRSHRPYLVHMNTSLNIQNLWSKILISHTARLR